MLLTKSGTFCCPPAVAGSIISTLNMSGAQKTDSWTTLRLSKMHNYTQRWNMHGSLLFLKESKLEIFPLNISPRCNNNKNDSFLLI